MSLLFNALSRFVIAFLPRSKHLLISWLQSASEILQYCFSERETERQRERRQICLGIAGGTSQGWQVKCRMVSTIKISNKLCLVEACTKLKNSLFIWNSDIFGHWLFLFAKSGSPRWGLSSSSLQSLLEVLPHHSGTLCISPGSGLGYQWLSPSSIGWDRTENTLRTRLSRVVKTNRDCVWSEGQHPSFSLTLTVPSLSPPCGFPSSLEGRPEPTVWGFVPPLEENQQRDLGALSPRSQTAQSALLHHVLADFDCQPGLELLGPAGACDGVGWGSLTSWHSRPSTGRSREGADGLVAGCHGEGALGGRAFSLSWGPAGEEVWWGHPHLPFP